MKYHFSFQFLFLLTWSQFIIPSLPGRSGLKFVNQNNDLHGFDAFIQTRIASFRYHGNYNYLHSLDQYHTRLVMLSSFPGISHEKYYVYNITGFFVWTDDSRRCACEKQTPAPNCYNNWQSSVQPGWWEQNCKQSSGLSIQWDAKVDSISSKLSFISQNASDDRGEVSLGQITIHTQNKEPPPLSIFDLPLQCRNVLCRRHSSEPNLLLLNQLHDLHSI